MNETNKDAGARISSKRRRSVKQDWLTSRRRREMLLSQSNLAARSSAAGSLASRQISSGMGFGN